MESGCVNESGDKEDYEVFLALHTAALKAARIPPLYWKSLHYKLKHEVQTAPPELKSVCVRARARDSDVSRTRLLWNKIINK